MSFKNVPYQEDNMKERSIQKKNEWVMVWLIMYGWFICSGLNNKPDLNHKPLKSKFVGNKFQTFNLWIYIYIYIERDHNSRENLMLYNSSRGEIARPPIF